MATRFVLIKWAKKLLAKYDRFCCELGVNQGTCRGCVPVVKFDPEKETVKSKANKKCEKND